MFQVPTKRPPLTKLNDYSWEISKDYKNDAPKMQVPARIFASKKLLDEMDLAVYEQISNVAALPGIVKAAMVITYNDLFEKINLSSFSLRNAMGELLKK